MTRAPLLCHPSAHFSSFMHPKSVCSVLPFAWGGLGFLGLTCKGKLSAQVLGHVGTSNWAKALRLQPLCMWWQEKVWVKVQAPLE